MTDNHAAARKALAEIEAGLEREPVFVDRIVNREGLRSVAAYVRALEKALAPFASVPPNGPHGGPMVAGHVWYEDGHSGYGDKNHAPYRDAQISSLAFSRARATLGGGDG